MASAFYPCADCGTSVEVLGHDPYAVRRQADRYATKGGRCRTCFAAVKKAESDAALAAAAAELADLTILPLDGSERQVAWAETIRADKLVAVRRSLSDGADAGAHQALDALCRQDDDRWWIDRRATAIPELIGQVTTPT